MCVSLCDFPNVVVFCILHRCVFPMIAGDFIFEQCVLCKKLRVVFCKKCFGEFQTQCKAYFVFVGLVLVFRAWSQKLEVVMLWA